MNHSLDQIALDGRVRAPFDTHRRGSTAPPEQHVDDRVDHRGVDDQQAVVIPLLRLEHRQHRRQGDGVQVVPEPDRGDLIEAHLHIVGGEVAQAGRHHPNQAVKDHLEHRQTLVVDHGAVDQRHDPGIVTRAVGVAIEA